MQAEDGVIGEAEFIQPVRDVVLARPDEPESFSAEIFRAMEKGPMSRLRRRKDGTISEADMNAARKVALAAADVKIRKQAQALDRLGQSALRWNGPLFGPAQALPSPADRATAADKPAGDDDAPSTETGWFQNHLTLRNVVAVFVFLGGGVWTFFTWYTSDKNVEIEHLKSSITTAVARADSAEKNTDAVEKAARIYKDANGTLQTERDAAKAEAATERTKTAAEQAKSAQLQKSLDAERQEKNKLIDALKAKSTAPVAAPTASGTK